MRFCLNTIHFDDGHVVVVDRESEAERSSELGKSMFNFLDLRRIATSANNAITVSEITEISINLLSSFRKVVQTSIQAARE